MSMEIYVFPPSPRAIKVMAVANHLGLDWTLRVLDPRKGDHMTPDYAALNPNCACRPSRTAITCCGNPTRSCSVSL